MIKLSPLMIYVTGSQQWICSPAATELEAITMDWAAKLLGLDESFLATSEVGGGIIQVRLSPITSRRSLNTISAHSVRLVLDRSGCRPFSLRQTAS